MELWLATVAAIVVLVVIGAAISRVWKPQSPARDLRQVLLARLVAAVLVTVAVVAAKIAIGSVAAAVTGVVGVAIAIAVLILTGYARIPPAHTSGR
jgi:hypothetical protein